MPKKNVTDGLDGQEPATLCIAAKANDPLAVPARPKQRRNSEQNGWRRIDEFSCRIININRQHKCGKPFYLQTTPTLEYKRSCIIYTCFMYPWYKTSGLIYVDKPKRGLSVLGVRGRKRFVVSYCTCGFGFQATLEDNLLENCAWDYPLRQKRKSEESLS